DRRDVDEYVLGAIVGRNEAEAFGGVEEFYGAGLSHLGKLLHPLVLVLLPTRQGGETLYALAVMHLRTVKPPTKKSGLSDIHTIGERVVQNVPVSGSANARTTVLLHGNVKVAR